MGLGIGRMPLTPREFDRVVNQSRGDNHVHYTGEFACGCQTRPASPNPNPHLLRQGKTSLETLGLLKSQFVALDRDGSGSLSFAEATDPFALAPVAMPTTGGVAIASNASRTERGRRVA